VENAVAVVISELHSQWPVEVNGPLLGDGTEKSVAGLFISGGQRSQRLPRPDNFHWAGRRLDPNYLLADGSRVSAGDVQRRVLVCVVDSSQKRQRMPGGVLGVIGLGGLDEVEVL